MSNRRTWVRMHPRDNVATALDALCKGMEIFDGEAEIRVTLKSNIPFGHKVALRDIPVGDPVIKYGEVIGEAGRFIGAGEHVHVHNVESRRGRGDLYKEAKS